MSSSDDQFNDEVREKLKSMRANFDREMEEKRFEFLHDSYLLIKDLKRKTVDLRDIFRREEIDLLLTKSVDLYNEEGAKYSGASIITFVADSGYKDEPELDENGKPSSRRTTHVHRAHRLQCYDLLYDLFAIYNRFDVNYTDELGLTHFHVACENGHTGVMKKFLEQGQVDPNLIATETGDAPLHFAMRSGDTEVIKLLLRNGADPNLANNEGSTPLHSRMIQLWFEGDRAEKTIFEICDEKQLRVQVDARDKLGNTPLHLALTNGRRGSTELLLRRDADPTSVNEKGETPLHIVCKGDKDDDLIELFFKICDEKNLKVDVNAKDSTDRTPLQWAVATLKLKVVNILMYRGADKSSFAFPTESHFDEAFKAFEKYEGHDLKLRLSSGFLATVKCLEKIGYKLELIDALTIMKLLVKYGMLRKSVDFVKRWRDDFGFTCRAQKIMIDSGLSIYDLLQLKFEEAAKRLTQVDCFKILEVANIWSQLLAESGDPYREKLSEWLARAFVCRWGLDPVSELTRLQ